MRLPGVSASFLVLINISTRVSRLFTLDFFEMTVNETESISIRVEFY